MLIELAAKDGFADRVLDVLLDGSAKRAGAKLWLVTLFTKEFLGSFIDFEREVALLQSFGDLVEFEIHDGNEVFFAQWSEDDFVIESAERITHVLSTPNFGATACLSIGQAMVEWVQDKG